MTTNTQEIHVSGRALELDCERSSGKSLSPTTLSGKFSKQHGKHCFLSSLATRPQIGTKLH
jgi:hypothetical protein